MAVLVQVDLTGITFVNNFVLSVIYHRNVQLLHAHEFGHRLDARTLHQYAAIAQLLDQLAFARHATHFISFVIGVSVAHGFAGYGGSQARNGRTVYGPHAIGTALTAHHCDIGQVVLHHNFVFARACLRFNFWNAGR